MGARPPAGRGAKSVALRVAVLTTQTKHHTYFLNRLAGEFELCPVYYERRRLKKKYATGPFFDADENEFEEKFFEPAMGGVPRELPSEVDRAVVELHSVNQVGVAEHLFANAPDIAITFGVGRVDPAIFEIPRWGTINVHRGITQRYRGLDSDLWAVHEENFDQIGVTIHFVDAQFDTGAIVSQKFVPVERQDALHHLRYKTTVVAVDLILEALREAERFGRSPTATPQAAPGAYYSAMPLETKIETLEKFRQYQAKNRQSPD